jgi:hypothetical protein
MISKLKIVIPTLWCGIGFYRGYKSYDHDEKIKNKNILKSIGYGFCGLFIYINPFSLPLIINVEYKKCKKYFSEISNS